MVYLQNIFEFECSEMPLRKVKYYYPLREDNFEFYKNSNQFIQLYKQVKAMRETKRSQIREELRKEGTSGVGQSTQLSGANGTPEPTTMGEATPGRVSLPLIKTHKRATKSTGEVSKLSTSRKQSKILKIRRESVGERKPSFLQKSAMEMYEK
jgi:hypothetical protein